jgi:putative restriction endonuclease
VTTWEQIQQNLLRLEAYRHSQETQEIDVYKGLVEPRKWFVVYKDGEHLLFAPSRFVGYANNNLSTHQGNDEKDGKVTNPAIDQVLGSSPEANALLEGEHHRLCAQLGITAKSGKRRYWLKH